MDGAAIPLSPSLVPCSSEGLEKGHFTTSNPLCLGSTWARPPALQPCPHARWLSPAAPVLHTQVPVIRPGSPEQPRWEKPTSFEVLLKQTDFKSPLAVQRAPGLILPIGKAMHHVPPQRALPRGDRRSPLPGSGLHPAWLKVFPPPCAFFSRAPIPPFGRSLIFPCASQGYGGFGNGLLEAALLCRMLAGTVQRGGGFVVLFGNQLAIFVFTRRCPL